MAIYSKKYGRTFKDRSELGHYQFWDRRTKPIFSWFGLRDCMYSDEYRRAHGLKTREDQRQGWKQAGIFVWVIAGIAWLSVLLSMCSKG